MNIFSTSVISYVSYLLCLTLFVYLVFLATFGLDLLDSGFVLSFVGRLKSGQILYKDFDIVRPFGNIIFWDLLLKIFSHNLKYVFLTSRILFIGEILAIAFMCVNIFSLNDKKNLFLPYFIIIFLTVSHNFNIMPWHTVDGIFFGIITIYFSKQKYYFTSIFFGLLCISTKQSFYFFGIISILQNIYFFYKNNFKTQKKDWIYSALGFALFIFIIYKYQLFQNYHIFFKQINSSSNASQLIESGVKSYFFKSTIPNILYVATLLIIFFEKKYLQRTKILKISGFILALIYVLPYFYTSQFFYTNQFLVLLFVIFIKIKKEDKTGYLLFLLAWSSSLSWGYNQPTFLIGAVFFYLFHSDFKEKILIIICFSILGMMLGLRILYPYFNKGILNEKYILCTDLPVISGIYMPVSVYNYYKEGMELKIKYKNVIFIPGSPLLDVITNSYENRASWEMDVEYPSYKNDFLNQKNKSLKYLLDKSPIIPFENGFFISTFTKEIKASKTKIDSSNYFYIYK